MRETCYVATEGLSAEQLLHGPIVALGSRRHARLPERRRPRREQAAGGGALGRVDRSDGADDHRHLPLGAAVGVSADRRGAADRAGAAERLGTDPDSFGRDVPSRAQALEGIEL